MRQLQIVGVVALLLVGVVALGPFGVAFASTTVKDVPSDHWAYQAVVRLVEQGYLGVDNDGTFNGQQSVDRYTLASVVAKVLDSVSSGESKAEEQDVALLRKLTTEFRDELVAWYKEKDALAGRVEALETDSELLKRQVYETVDQLTSIDAEIVKQVQELRSSLGAKDTQLESSVSQITTAVSGLEGTVADHTRQLDQANKQIANQAQAINNLQGTLGGSVENRFQEREMALAMVKEDLAKTDQELKVALDTLQAEQANLATELQSNDGELTETNARLTQSIDSQGQALAQLDSTLGEVQSTLAGLKDNFETSQAANDVRISDQEKRLKAVEAQVKGYQEKVDQMQSELKLLRQRFLTVEDTVVRIGKVVTQLDDELGRDLDANTTLALQRYRMLENNLGQLEDDLNLERANAQQEIHQLKKTNNMLILGGGLAIILLFVLGQ